MCCKTSHDVLVSDLDAFLMGTFHEGVRTSPGEPPMIVGSCPTCAERLEMAICERRGTVVHGEIEGR